MEYAEVQFDPGLRIFANSIWTLESNSAEHPGLTHRATPDGSIEIIRRLRGGSTWHREQPAHFVAGLIDQPAELGFSSAAAFVALRLWPWTWHALGGRSCGTFINDWIPLEGAGLPVSLHRLLMNLDKGSLVELSALFSSLQGRDFAAVAAIVLDSSSVAELAERTGRSPRWLQRWFQRHVGVTPCSYLRLLRFQDTLRSVSEGQSSLTWEAVEHGYADHAHMAREFRSLSGLTASFARKKARGPFV